MLYSLIAYKPSSSDYCRGCLMASYRSDFEAWTGTDANALATRWADIRERNRNMEQGESGFDVLVLIDGVPLPNSDVQEFDAYEAREALWARQEALEPEFDRIQKLTDEKLAALDAQRAQAAADAARQAALAQEAAARAAAIAKEKAERAEYARLAAKFKEAK